MATLRRIQLCTQTLLSYLETKSAESSQSPILDVIRNDLQNVRVQKNICRVDGERKTTFPLLVSLFFFSQRML